MRIYQILVIDLVYPITKLKGKKLHMFWITFVREGIEKEYVHLRKRADHKNCEII